MLLPGQGVNVHPKHKNVHAGGRFLSISFVNIRTFRHILHVTSHIVSLYIFPCGSIYHFMLAYISNIYVFSKFSAVFSKFSAPNRIAFLAF